MIERDEETFTEERIAMKKLSMNTLRILLPLCLVGTLWFTVPAHAGFWVDMHGTSGRVESPGNTLGVKYRGYGLEFTQKLNTKNWVHFQIPTTWSGNIRSVYVQYYVDSASGEIVQFAIYNGRKKLKTVTAPATAVGWNQMQIDFGGYLYFTRGLGVSMNVTAAGEDARFIVSDVAAYFKD
jgi:hypothetical protein